ncbi:MAG: hypothetical protein ACJA0Q_001681 [Saprospiraceae bacterium]|jgi:hypothetical protein
MKLDLKHRNGAIILAVFFIIAPIYLANSWVGEEEKLIYYILSIQIVLYTLIEINDLNKPPIFLIWLLFGIINLLFYFYFPMDFMYRGLFLCVLPNIVAARALCAFSFFSQKRHYWVVYQFGPGEGPEGSDKFSKYDLLINVLLLISLFLTYKFGL